MIAGVNGKVSVDDKMRMREQGLGYRAIVAKYPEKNWKLNTVKLICKRVHETGSALTRKPGADRPRSVRTPKMIEQVSELISSRENQPGTSKSNRKIAEQLNIHRSSVQRIVKRDLQLSVFQRVPAQIISESVKQKRRECCKKLIRRLPVKFADLAGLKGPTSKGRGGDRKRRGGKRRRKGKEGKGRGEDRRGEEWSGGAKGS